MDMQNVSWPGWETVQLIGTGGFGSVYEIRRDVFGKTEKAALKVIRIPRNREEIEELYNEGFDDDSITAHFRGYLEDVIREYSLMLDMKGHTNVVYCDDLRYVQHDDGIGWDIYIKMELLTPLGKALGGQYDEAQTLHLAKDICNALILCRKENIVHRDIKPQNIFVSRTGDYKLGDFGVAKISEKTASGTKIGTFDYMAPEVYRGQAYGAAADIYSLGIVLYWLMNERRTPFLPVQNQIPTVGQKEQARQKRFSGAPLPPPAHGSRRLQEIVWKACAFDPARRYATADEMLEDLLDFERSLQEDKTVFQPETPAGTYRKPGAQVIQDPVSAPVQKPAPERPVTPPPQPQKPAEPKPAPPTPEKKPASPAKPKRRKVPAWPFIVGGIVAAIWLVVIIVNIVRLMPQRGWQEEYGRRYYYHAGEAVTGKCNIDGDDYYFHNDGTMATGEVMLDGETYVFDSDGKFLYRVVREDYPTSNTSVMEETFETVDGGTATGNYQYLAEVVENCTSLHYSMELTEVTYGTPPDQWALRLCMADGTWQLVQTFVLDRQTGECYVEFSEPVSFYAFTGNGYGTSEAWSGSVYQYLTYVEYISYEMGENVVYY